MTIFNRRRYTKPTLNRTVDSVPVGLGENATRLGGAGITTETDELLMLGVLDLQADAEVGVGAEVVASSRGGSRVKVTSTQTPTFEKIWVITILVVCALSTVDHTDSGLWKDIGIIGTGGGVNLFTICDHVDL